ncbi:hypothetical protein BJV78DRAFT_1215500, partial [Lactifluus subvellereus]
RVDDLSRERCKQIRLARISVEGAPKCSFQAQQACPPYITICKILAPCSPR